MANTITPQIVTINTTVQTAPTPSQLQQSGAIVSTGGTTLAANAYQYCGNPAAVTALLSAPLALTSLAWASGVVTATSAATLALASGQTFTTTISGAVPAGYNGTFTATVTGTDTFTYPLASNPGLETAPGSYLPNDAAFVNDAATEFFAQGQTVGVYVLELGPQTTAAAGITALGTFITDASPQVFYAYLIPKSWDAGSSVALNTLAATYDSPSGQTYFVVTTTQANISAYAGTKSVLALVPSPTAASTEEQPAALFYNILVNNPGPANILQPLQYRYLYAVTPWAQQGNSAAVNAILSAYGNVVGTGAEGGISTACLFKGTSMDGIQFSEWFGIDYCQINFHQAIAAEIIQGANQQPPLLYNQSGLNTLLAVAENEGTDAVKYGCASVVTITAVPFSTYIAENPTEYAKGIYTGFSASVTSQKGFLTITFNLGAFFIPV
ncbi:MAG: hypothetical protein ACYDBH_01535 [Acidobacteriaceae bacterium]